MVNQTKVLQLATSREARASATLGPNDFFYDIGFVLIHRVK